MRTIYDPVSLWLAAPPLALFASDKRPVTVPDAVSVAQDGGPVTIQVLLNDFDPEGSALMLLSATAALGTAVAEGNGTVIYTPPPGVAGFDTVVYTIADGSGQTRDGQIDVTIVAPELAVEIETDNTLTVRSEAGPLTVTVTEPASLAGVYPLATGALAGGPVNLAPPPVAGSAAPGQVLSAGEGLWAVDRGAGAPSRSRQWLRGGAEIAGATGSTYTVQTSDLGPGLSLRETLADGFGQRTATSAPLGQTFVPSQDGSLIGWWDASDPGTITQSGGEVAAWASKAGGAALTQPNAVRRPVTGTRVLNGGNVLDFGGAAFLTRALAVPVSGDIAIHMALVIDSTANAFEAVLALDGAANDFQIDANSSTGFAGRLNATGIGPVTPFSGGPFAGAMILSAVFDRTGGTARMFLGGVQRATMAYGAAIDASAVLNVMTNRSQNAWVNGAVAEVVVTGSTANRADHHAYLAAKWGLS